MLLHGKIGGSSVNGPGNRIVLHFQGCDLGCVGCWNPDTHLFRGDKLVNMPDLEDWILDQKGITGITFSGGEPMQQAQFFWYITEFIKRQRPEWSLILFTGYSIKELERGAFKWYRETDAEWQQGSAKLWKEISGNLDLVVAGRYNESKRTNELPLRGSTNQELVFLTDRIKEGDLSPQEVEMTFDPETGLVQITGFPVGWEEYDMTKDRKPATVEAPPLKAMAEGDDDDDGMLVGAGG
jgi:anaerobic ribonucleoside-triphosphate reductase activating protein